MKKGTKKFVMNMFSIEMISLPTAAVITAIIGAGLAMVVNPPWNRSDGETVEVVPSGK